MGNLAKTIVIIAVAVIAAWWFRYDIKCATENCVAYDRWFGRWVNVENEINPQETKAAADITTSPAAEAAAPVGTHYEILGFEPSNDESAPSKDKNSNKSGHNREPEVINKVTNAASEKLSNPEIVEITEGQAPCVTEDGFQTVHFDDGNTYSGYFANCMPLAGEAKYVTTSGTYTGYAEPVLNSPNTVILRFEGGEVTITMTTEPRNVTRRGIRKSRAQ